MQCACSAADPDYVPRELSRSFLGLKLTAGVCCLVAWPSGRRKIPAFHLAGLASRNPHRGDPDLRLCGWVPEIRCAMGFLWRGSPSTHNSYSLEAVPKWQGRLQRCMSGDVLSPNLVNAPVEDPGRPGVEFADFRVFEGTIRQSKLNAKATSRTGGRSGPNKVSPWKRC